MLSLDMRFSASPNLVLDAETLYTKSKFVKNSFIIKPQFAKIIRDLSAEFHFILFKQTRPLSIVDKLVPRKEPDYSSLGDLVETQIDYLPELLAENLSPLFFANEISDPRINEILLGTGFRAVPFLRNTKQVYRIIDNFKYVENRTEKEEEILYAENFRSMLKKNKYARNSDMRLSNRLDEEV